MNQTKEMAAALKDLLTQFEVNQEKWVAKYGTTDGYKQWFSKQLFLGFHRLFGYPEKEVS